MIFTNKYLKDISKSLKEITNQNYAHIHKTSEKYLTGLADDRIDIIEIDTNWFFFKSYRIVYRLKVENLPETVDVINYRTNENKILELIIYVHKEFKRRKEYFKNAGLELLDHRGTYIRTVGGLIIDFSKFNSYSIGDTYLDYYRKNFNDWLYDEKNPNWLNIVSLCGDIVSTYNFNQQLKNNKSFLR